MARQRQAPLWPLLAALVVALVVTGTRQLAMAKIDDIYEWHDQVVTDQMEIIYRQQDEISQLKSRIRLQELRVQELERKLEQAEQWVPVEMETTGYAPLDPQAVTGMCYSGDPTITASGEASTPGISIAAGPGVPFGTEMYVPGYGVGVVHDRGGMITDQHIDLMFATRGQALTWGRQTVTVWVKEGAK